MNIVIDTNVIISAILNPKGIPRSVLNLVGNDESVKVYYSTAILAEYQRVLSYKRLNISIDTQIETLDAIKNFGILIEPKRSNIPLPDETDRIFYDTAQAAGAILVTGNIKHYPTEPFILTPKDFIEKIADG